MYQKPCVERLGSFRELTKQGQVCAEKDLGGADGLIIAGVVQAVSCHIS